MTPITHFKSMLSAGTTAALLLASVPAGAIDPVQAAKATDTPVAAAQDSGERQGGGFLSGIFGCQADGNKQTIGAVAGGAIGGLLGNRIAGRGSRTLGTIIGGALGAAGGSALGCKLQKNDQAKAERAMEDAVTSGKDQAWKSDETGATGKVEVGQAALTGAGLADLKLASGVDPADGYNKVGGTYISTADANIRSAPNVSGKVLGRLANGQRVWVPASVQGAPWFLISDKNVGQGYVSNALLKREASATASNCKMVKQTVDVPGSGSTSETYQACKGSDGQWAMTRV
jgi:surface antigen